MQQINLRMMPQISVKGKKTKRERGSYHKQLHCSQSVFVIAHQLHGVILPLALIQELFDASATDQRHMENVYV